MAVELENRDGDLWWLSPDVWVVPGTDPEGSPGTPIAGTPAYMWARVRNNGTSTVNNAEVRFYWADPSAAFDRNTAHYVGSSFVSLGPAEISDVSPPAWLRPQPLLPPLQACLMTGIHFVSVRTRSFPQLMRPRPWKPFLWSSAIRSQLH